MNNDYNNGLIVGALLGLTVTKRYVDVIELADSFSIAPSVELDISPMTVLVIPASVQISFVEIGAIDVSAIHFSQTLLELEVLP